MMTGWRTPNVRVPFLEMRGGSGCARNCGFPHTQKITTTRPPRERRSGSRTSRSSPAADLRPKRKNKNKNEKRTARVVGMGGGVYFAPHDTNNIFWILDPILIFLHFYLRTQYSIAYGRPIAYLMGGSLVEAHWFFLSITA
jgi:hypothetical protein